MEAKWTHMLDPDNKFDLGKAYRSCRHCYGTGIVGKMPLMGNIRLVCKCVIFNTAKDESILINSR